ncbi:MAG: hypothetical protein ACXWP5_16780 [Bdellovibrionota bacterium]
MNRMLVTSALMGAFFAAAGAMAADQQPTPVQQRDDARIRCEFGTQKKESNCRVFAIIDLKKLSREWVRGDRDDKLRVVCDDNDGDRDRPIYDDGVAYRRDRDADDHGERTDIQLRGLRDDGDSPAIQIEDVNLRYPSSSSASLWFRLRGESVKLRGSCEIERQLHDQPPGPPGTN